jgi:hypothetical protein
MVEPQRERGIAGVNCGEQTPNRARVRGMRVLHACHETGARRIERSHARQVTLDRFLRTRMRCAHASARLQPVLSLERPLLPDPESRVRIRSCKHASPISRSGMGRDAALGPDREPR